MATVKAPPTLAPTVLRGVTYDVYVRLRDDPRNRGLRMTYHDGVLELMSPEFVHEKGAERLALIVRAYAAAFGVDCQGVRCTTFRRGVLGKARGQGKEPDAGFYFGPTADAVRDKDRLDLKLDPPPDLWIESDHRNSSKGRLPLYAGLGVPEVWRYLVGRRSLWFGLLTGGQYTASDRSRCLPGLTTQTVLDLLAEAERMNETAWDLWMRQWMPANLRHTEP